MFPNPMPAKAHLSPPRNPNTHTIMECDEVLARGCPSIEITDAWLEERLNAMHATIATAADRAVGAGLASG